MSKAVCWSHPDEPPPWVPKSTRAAEPVMAVVSQLSVVTLSRASSAAEPSIAASRGWCLFVSTS